MNELERKFQIKPALVGGVYGLPEDWVLPFPEEEKFVKGSGDYAVVFVKRAAEINALSGKAVRVLRDDGLLLLS